MKKAKLQFIDLIHELIQDVVPGEAREADIGIAGGKGEAVLFIHGKPIKKLTGDNILDQFMDEIYKL